VSGVGGLFGVGGGFYFGHGLVSGGDLIGYRLDDTDGVFFSVAVFIEFGLSELFDCLFNGFGAVEELIDGELSFDFRIELDN
jgi:hypothetical protein